jgi:hypothetical protein
MNMKILGIDMGSLREKELWIRRTMRSVESVGLQVMAKPVAKCVWMRTQADGFLG